MNRVQRFERTQPREWRALPFETNEEAPPTACEAIGWLMIGCSFAALCFGFLGL